MFTLANTPNTFVLASVFTWMTPQHSQFLPNNSVLLTYFHTIFTSVPQSKLKQTNLYSSVLFLSRSSLLSTGITLSSFRGFIFLVCTAVFVTTFSVRTFPSNFEHWTLILVTNTVFFDSFELEDFTGDFPSKIFGFQGHAWSCLWQKLLCWEISEQDFWCVVSEQDFWCVVSGQEF